LPAGPSRARTGAARQYSSAQFGVTGDVPVVQLQALADLHDLEADVSVNLETAEVEFYIVVEAPDARAAFTAAFEVQDRAMAVAGVPVLRSDEAHARRADLIPA
ncbi:MAG: hypothetical protein ACRD0N_07360, partial [Acidimicrobiales bacterium]